MALNEAGNLVETQFSHFTLGSCYCAVETYHDMFVDSPLFRDYSLTSVPSSLRERSVNGGNSLANWQDFGPWLNQFPPHA
jgi:hypothetical protein